MQTYAHSVIIFMCRTNSRLLLSVSASVTIFLALGMNRILQTDSYWKICIEDAGDLIERNINKISAAGRGISPDWARRGTDRFVSAYDKTLSTYMIQLFPQLSATALIPAMLPGVSSSRQQYSQYFMVMRTNCNAGCHWFSGKFGK